MKEQIPAEQDSINEADERRLLRAAAGYTRADHIRKLTIIKELIVFNILHMRVGYQTNWFNHMERMKESRYAERFYLYTPKDIRRR
jgi:hypothetical protein